MQGAESEGIRLQRELATLCLERVMPAIERVLDGFAQPHTVLRIDRLELDAGVLLLGELEQALPRVVERALAQELAIVAGRHAPAEAFGAHPVEGTAGVRDGAVRQLSVQQAMEEALAFFLANGTLPSTCHLAPGESLHAAVLAAWHDADTAGDTASGTVGPLWRALQDARARQRLVLQFPPEFLQTLLSRLAPAQAEAARQAAQQLRRVRPQDDDAGETGQRLWHTAFAHAAAGRAFDAAGLLAEAGQQGADPAHRLAGDETLFYAENAAHGSQPGKTAAHPVQDPVTRPELPQVEVTTADHPEADAGIYIGNAGLLLLHPFLERFLEIAGVARDGALLHPKQAPRLLHYLGSGEAFAPEHELPLPKILCNVPLMQPVAAAGMLDAMQIEEAEAMLAAVILHWEALRNCSPAALRETFLRRPGKLSRRDGDWLLQVEAQAFDILLNQLPWSISMIRLPWMDSMLWVEWG